MAKEKLTLSDLKVQSFVTTLDEAQMNRLKGGYMIKGRRFTYRTRWTAVDIRADDPTVAISSATQGG
ncbi:MAG: pinensin family lanthipeptide [Saprospiraceae bacterium]|nr:pinensin family lanthipeptide [Saprospiraceae bacterium]